MLAPLRFLSTLLVLVFLSASVAAETLCMPTETVYFSCKLARTTKIVSLCGSSSTERDSFWLQYRFGTSTHLELVYPRSIGVPFANSGFDVGYFRRSNGFDTEVSFINDGWSYTVFSWVPGEGETANTYGVFVARKREGPGTTFHCKTLPNFGPNDVFSSFAQSYANDN